MSLSYLESLYTTVKANNSPTMPLDEYLDITSSAFEDESFLIDATLLDGVFEVAADICDDANIGINSGIKMRSRQLGTLGILLSSANSMADMFNIHERYSQLISNATSQTYTPMGESLCMTLRVDPNIKQISRHRIEYSLSGWLQLAKWIVGDQLTIKELNLSYPQSSSHELICQHFNCEPNYNQKATQILFPLPDVENTLDNKNEHLRRVLEIEANEMLRYATRDSRNEDIVIKAVKQYVRKNLSHGTPTLAQIAKHLSQSERSLQRRFQENATHFRQILDETRMEVVKQKILDDNVDLVELTFALGFGDQSSFQRAFKRWFGITPKKFMRLQNPHHLKETAQFDSASNNDHPMVGHDLR